MIYDSLKNAGRYACMSENFRCAFELLCNNDLSRLPVGRYDINGENVFLMIQEPELKPWCEGRWEAHRRYADIQLVLDGCECIGYCIADEKTEIETPYDTESDTLFYTGIEGNSAIVTPGEMMVLFPEDAHRPCIQPSDNTAKVRKAVVKVLL